MAYRFEFKNAQGKKLRTISKDTLDDLWLWLADLEMPSGYNIDSFDNKEELQDMLESITDRPYAIPNFTYPVTIYSDGCLADAYKVKNRIDEDYNFYSSDKKLPPKAKDFLMESHFRDCKEIEITTSEQEATYYPKPSIVKSEIIDTAHPENDIKYYWLLVSLDTGEQVSFTLTKDNEIYLENPDGSALDASEQDFVEKYGEQTWFKEFIFGLKKFVDKLI